MAIESLLTGSSGASVVHIRNNGRPGDPDAPGTPGWELYFRPHPGEPVVDKHECNAFVGTSLADRLPSSAPLLIAGMQSEYCVRATTLAALERGHPVTVLRGAHATYDDDGPASEIASAVERELAGAGAAVADWRTAAFG